uniref:Uncharacterized protein n=1 Tax=Heterorhabditis bacteriophora TaxID=37862 RepID=A0A1I7X673_HETBA
MGHNRTFPRELRRVVCLMLDEFLKKPLLGRRGILLELRHLIVLTAFSSWFSYRPE